MIGRLTVINRIAFMDEKRNELEIIQESSTGIQTRKVLSRHDTLFFYIVVKTLLSD